MGKYSRHTKKHKKHKKHKKAGTYKQDREIALSLATTEHKIPPEIRKIILSYDKHNQHQELATKLSKVWRKYKMVDTNLELLLKTYVQMIKENSITPRQKEYIRNHIINEVLPIADDYDSPYWMLQVTPDSRAEMDWSLDDIMDNANISDANDAGKIKRKKKKSKKRKS